LSYVLSGSSSAPAYCVRAGLKFALGSAGLARMISQGLQSLVPVSNEIGTLLKPACIEAVTDNPTAGVVRSVQLLADCALLILATSLKCALDLL
jgi:hypothetical protein